ncbi:MAG: hypothetical protein ACLFVK_05860 [Dehalococcoidia bacterium]
MHVVPPPMQMARDGSGGCIVVWTRNIPDPDKEKAGFIDSDIYAQRISAQGDLVWQESGVPVHIAGSPIVAQVVSDGQGGAMIASSQGYVRRISSEGNLKWPQGSVKAPGIYSGSEAFQMVSDGSGGVITLWGCMDNRLMIQRIDGTGKTMWPEDGVALFRVSEEECEYGIGFAAPVMESDGEGGVFIVWHEGNRSYIQHVNADGNKAWGGGGILLND